MLSKVWLEILLALSVLSLAAQIAWPSMIRWWQRPRPGTVGVDQLESRIAGIGKDFLLYLPPDEVRGRLPLVVYLHGSGERGVDPTVLREVGPFAALRNGKEIPAVIVAPQCLPDIAWEPKSIAAFVEDLASRYNIDRDRTYLIGHSMGGYGVWHTAAVHPELFAAIVPICGGGDPERAEALGDLPIWAFHGEHDEVVPVTESERMIDAIRVAGGEPRLTALPEAGHGICDDVCRRDDLWTWLLSNQRPARDER
jgi:pimeloyl-ACP methyl ester carboxylesterase